MLNVTTGSCVLLLLLIHFQRGTKRSRLLFEKSSSEAEGCVAGCGADPMWRPGAPPPPAQSSAPSALSAPVAHKPLGEPFLGADKHLQLVWRVLKHASLASFPQKTVWTESGM